MRKIKDINDNKIATEFNYKMLHNILCNNAYLRKWIKDKGDNCNLCKTTENTKHLLFKCKNVEHIWKTLGSFLVIDINWKHIILGFYLEKKLPD